MAEWSPRVNELFLKAFELPDATARQAFLDRECGGDVALHRAVATLLKAHNEAGDFLRPSPASSVAGTAGSFAPVEGATGSFAGEDGGQGAIRTTALPGRGEDVGAVVGGKYKLIEEIGEGGMGSVFMAQQTEPVKRAVAVKVIKAGMDSKAVLARFEAERQALAMMDHPNIARVLDAGTTDRGRPYFVMELVKGIPITEFCDQRKLTPRQRLELFVPVCQAIQHAHQKGVIHRDIKPSNVLVAMYDDSPVPKVIDFGVAKATGQSLTDKTLMTGFGAIVGTPEYMSPEQANFNQMDVDTRSDVYALGVLLYELLTGTTPVDRKSLGKAAILEILRVVREVEAPKPSAKLSSIDTLPSVAANRGTEPAKLSRLMKGELDCVLLKALEKDRSRRYESANGLARDIQRYLADEIVEARPPSAGYRLKKFVRRHKGQVSAASLVLLVLVGGAIGTIIGLLKANAAAKQAMHAEMLARMQRDEAEAATHMAAEQRMAAELGAQQTKMAESEAKVVLNFLASTIMQGQFDELFHGRPNGDTTLRAALLGAEKEVPHAFRDQPMAEATVRYMIGTRLLVFEETEAAVRNLERAYTLRKAKLGPAHEDTIATAYSLAIGLSGLNQHDRAIRLLEEIRALRLAQPPGTRGVAVALDALTESLADVYENAGRFDDAIRLWQSVAESHPRPDEDRAMALRNLGHILVVASRPREAERALRESLAIFESHQDKEWIHNWIRFDVMSELGESLLQQKRYSEAEPLLLSAYQELKAREGHDIGKGPLVGDDHLPEAASRLARLYEATGRPALAAGWRAKGRPERAPRPREVKR